MFKYILIVGSGGFIGTVFRYLITRYIQLHSYSVFPWSTFTVNILGSLLIGGIYGLSERENILTSEIRLFLTVGICGGFTTFSSLSSDAFMLLQEREMLRFALYTSLSFFFGLLAVYLGRLLIKLF